MRKSSRVMAVSENINANENPVEYDYSGWNDNAMNPPVSDNNNDCVTHGIDRFGEYVL